MQPMDIKKLSEEDRARLMQIDYSEPVYHVGRQWAVTSYGIEEIGSDAGHQPYYHIPGDDLSLEVGHDSWPGHMAEKTWVDVEDFVRAFKVAQKVHQR